MKPIRYLDRLKEFVRREDGSYTVEAVIWTPVFALIIALMADTSLIFGDQSLVMTYVQSAARGLSVGEYTSVADAETYLTNQVHSISPHASVNISVNNQGVITAVVGMPTRDLTATGLVSAFSNATVYVKSTQLSEG